MKISTFWLSGAKRKDVKGWAERDAQLRREHWQNRTPAELIDYDRYRQLPKKRRAAIEQAAYKQAG